jgi:hypothetical protein
MAVLISGIACAREPVEAVSAGDSGASEGAETMSASPTSTTESLEAGTSSTSGSDDASNTTTTTTSVASTGESTSGERPTSTDTGPMRIGCDDLALAETDPVVCSMSGAPATLYVMNECEDESIEMFWINGSCEEVSYGIVVPGEDFTSSSFTTHLWRVRATSDGRLLVEIPALTRDTTIEVP